MALFMIEREFAEQVLPDTALIDEVEAYNSDVGLRWLFSFLSADGKKAYCLYEATDPEALRAQAEALGVPADAIVEVNEVNPALFASGGSVTGHAYS